jgi:hypothetical protein
MAHPKLKSIYTARFDRPFHDEGVTRSVRYIEPGKPSPLPAVAQDSTLDWSMLRKVRPVNYMLPMSMAWLSTLPKHVRPMALVTQYPRIANAIALEWDRPVACRAYFADLLVDHRGARKGFPADVYRDLTTLRDHYYDQGLRLEGLGLQLVE